jgi:hypothetical protein
LYNDRPAGRTGRTPRSGRARMAAWAEPAMRRVGPCPTGAQDRPSPADAACDPRTTSRTLRRAGTGNGDPAAARQLRAACLMPAAKLRTRGHGDRGRVFDPFREPVPDSGAPRVLRAGCPDGLALLRAQGGRRAQMLRCVLVPSFVPLPMSACLHADARARGGTGRSPGRSLKVTTVTTTATAGRSRQPGT